MKNLFSNPKTTLGGIVIIVGVLMLAFHQLTFQQAVELMGLGAGWASFNAQDGKP